MLPKVISIGQHEEVHDLDQHVEIIQAIKVRNIPAITVKPELRTLVTISVLGSQLPVSLRGVIILIT